MSLSDNNARAVEVALKDFSKRLQDGLEKVERLQQSVTGQMLLIVQMQNELHMLKAQRGTGPSKG